MTQDGAIPATRAVTPLGWLLIGFRLVLMVLVFMLCAPLHLLWRAFGFGRFWPRVFLASIGAIAGLHITVRGQPARHALLLSNHVSWLDIPTLAHVTGSAFVAHDGLADFVFLKWLCEMNDTIFIARHDRQSVAEQVEQVRAAMATGGALTIFPEGTTSDGTGLLPFKSALLSAATPLPPGIVAQPVSLDYENSRQVCWVGDEPGLDNFLRLLARPRPIRVTAHFLAPLAGEELADRKAMAATAHAKLLRHLSQ
ncbi:1-acylglycerol-3-phosphate O-acyltransferase [Alteripontixanthobacter maritimus]|uniref:1-acylglycerol-3-phosphate O-acyltransferase n=1 Tax=Alteripontixanthobacter maritimus TaxID=2161824 RepID=A0A369Q7U0_9SPHN|nr:lysophospholipid acyltransferase family protein [Alteripontixanthobacter maritimus]RDC59595.1 1-acylglycerol-3-phosphate O-acyltransferase [Alteripontixanthobacter maritimus]